MNKPTANFEDRLTSIVMRVEKSGWTDEDKEEMYAKISEYLYSIVLPVVLKYTPDAQLKEMAASPSKVTIDAFIDLLRQPLSNPTMYDELNKTVHSVLDDVETALQKGGVA